MTKEVEKNFQTIIPPVDIIETKNSYIVKLDIPGAGKEHIKAKIEDNILVVSASIVDQIGTGKESETMKEYQREFSLANDIDTSTVDAKYELGVLTVTLNKKIQFLPKEIVIN
ncbi:MAG: Hsp20/alpha crystallin family protein [Bacteroidota bacterium]|nr:Hsp20/alpha crystallin family protein [Bacteroidota bacterium]